MNNTKGLNIKNAKIKNKLAIIHLLATNKNLSRIELSKLTGLTKMTLSNLITELIEENIVKEIVTNIQIKTPGRNPIILDISQNAPYIYGVLIRRNICQITITNLKGEIINIVEENYPKILTNNSLETLLKKLFSKISKNNKRKMLGIGISSIGPIDDIKGLILSPPDFGEVCNFNIVDFFKSLSPLPIFLINDANAGALAEKMYGLGKNIDNYIYLHIMNGIGAGLVLENKIYTGNLGQGGEIGHTSLNFNGPLCSCGNRGCLDCYTSISNILKKANDFSYLSPNSKILKIKNLSLKDLIDQANNEDLLAMFLMDEFCTYISYALSNILTIIDSSSIIIGYDCKISGNFIEKTISKKLNSLKGFAKYKNITITHSFFNSQAPLIGAAAIVASKYFSGDLNI